MGGLYCAEGAPLARELAIKTVVFYTLWPWKALSCLSKDAFMINVLFFGRMADVSETRTLTVEMPAGGLRLVALRDRIFADAMAAGRVGSNDIRMSVNRAVVNDDQPLADGDEVAFFSIFSGG
jgi:molybdopterin synthase sulfur carrier subunit